MRSTANRWGQTLVVFESCPSHDMARPFPHLVLFFFAGGPQFGELALCHPSSGSTMRAYSTLILSLDCKREFVILYLYPIWDGDFIRAAKRGTLRSSRPFLRFWVDNLSGCNKTILSSPVSGSGSIFLSGLQQESLQSSLPVSGSVSAFLPGVQKENLQSSLYLSSGRGLVFNGVATKRIRHPLYPGVDILSGLRIREFAILSSFLRVGKERLTGLQTREFAILSSFLRVWMESLAGSDSFSGLDREFAILSSFSSKSHINPDVQGQASRIRLDSRDHRGDREVIVQSDILSWLCTSSLALAGGLFVRWGFLRLGKADSYHR